MADATFELCVFGVQLGAQLRGAAQVGTRPEDAERARAAAHAERVDRVWGLTGLLDDAKDIPGREFEHGQPVVDLAPRDAQPLVAPPGCALRPFAAFIAAESHRIDEASPEVRMSLEVPAKLAGDRPGFRVAGTPSACGIRPSAPLFDALKKRFAGGDGCQDEGHARGHRVLDVLDRPRPLDFPERRVNYNKLIAANDAREQNRHRLAVLAARGVDRDQGAMSNQPPALARDGNIDSGHGVDSRMDEMCRMSGAVPRSGLRASAGPRRASPPCGAVDDGAGFPDFAGERDGVRARENRYAEITRRGPARVPVVKRVPGLPARRAEPRIALGRRNRSDGPGRAERLAGRRVSPTESSSLSTVITGGGR